MKTVLAGAAIVMLASAPVSAQDAGATGGTVVSSPTLDDVELPRAAPPELADGELNLGWALVQTLVVLGMVVALAYLSLNVGLRRLLGLQPAAGRRGLVTVLERVPLDQKRSLYVVKAGDDVLLLGSSELNLSFLAKLDPRVLETPAAAAAPAGPAQMSPFLQKLLGRKDAPPPAGPPPAST